MTNSKSDKADISEVLWSNAQINYIHFQKREFTPTTKGHGPYVKTIGQDILYDLRLAKHKPFWGHTHPLATRHNFKNLSLPLEINQYSVPKTEFIRIIETFQEVHFSEVLQEDFKITYHNIVIDIDESILNYDFEYVRQKLAVMIEVNPKTFFWLIERDLILFSEDSLFNFYDLMSSDHVHLCLDFHFVSSVFLYSHHLFSEDDNIQLFLALRNFYNEILSPPQGGKNSIDFKLIDNFLEQIPSEPMQRIGRYILVNKELSMANLNNNGIIFSSQAKPGESIFAIPMSCTNTELLDILERIKNSIQE
jgi:hypothetical protein